MAKRTLLVTSTGCDEGAKYIKFRPNVLTGNFRRQNNLTNHIQVLVDTYCLLRWHNALCEKF